MNLPSLKQAKIRGKEEVKILYDDFIKRDKGSVIYG